MAPPSAPKEAWCGRHFKLRGRLSIYMILGFIEIT